MRFKQASTCFAAKCSKALIAPTVTSIILSALVVGCANLAGGLSQSGGHDFRKAKWGYSQSRVMITEQGKRIHQKTDNAVIFNHVIDDIQCKIFYCFKDDKLRAAGYIMLEPVNEDFMSALLHSGQIRKWGNDIWAYLSPTFFEELKKARFPSDELSYYEAMLLGMEMDPTMRRIKGKQKFPFNDFEVD
ncbi:MAG: hypothetical protein OXN17_22585 [Candidatus Poribacteria bacterium]|nr:hypothetical protein [Candidatus Poribacteria bacterium]MDE0502743.1 hypothetical protein [Candidatus Poribacteria bacterium]